MKRNLMILTFLCLGLLIHPTASAALKDGLVAYWPVDGNLTDETINAHDGTDLGNGGSALSYVPGKFGQAANFSGAWGGGVNAGTWSPNVHNGPFSVACWARWQAGGPSQWQGLVGKRDNYSDLADTPEVNNYRSYWYVELSHDAAATQKTRDLYLQNNGAGPGMGGNTLISGQWQYVVATYEGGVGRLYLDGKEVAIGPLVLDERDINNHVVFGCTGYDPDLDRENPFSGALDEIAIWNRKLTAAEVTELYNNGNGKLFGINTWKPTNPVPTDGTKGLPVDADLTLQWSAPTVVPPQPITMYDVYLGTDKAAVADANNIVPSPLKLGRIMATDPLQIIVPKAKLQRDKTYYWRVDALIDLNEPNQAIGRIWSFETKKSVPVVLTDPTDQVVAEGASASFSVTIESLSEYTVKWYRVGDNALMGTTNPLVIPVVDKNNWGDKYYCVPRNAAGDGVASNAAGAYFKTLVAHYTCDEDVSVNKLVADSSGLKNKHDATAMSTTASVPGIYGGGLSFNGINNWVNCGTWNPSQATGQMTVSFWSKWGGSNQSWQGFAGKRNNWGDTTMMWTITCHDQTGGRVQIESGRSWPWFGQNALPVGEWSHVAVTYDGTMAAVFINGHRVSNPQPFSMSLKTDASLVFGATGSEPADPYKGVLDDVRFYNYALTPTEIGEMAAVGLGRPVCPVSPPYDYNQDCFVNLPDLVILLSNWMECNIVPTCL